MMSRKPLRKDNSSEAQSTCRIRFNRSDDGTLIVQLSGNWQIGQASPSGDELRQELKRAPQARHMAFDTQDLAGWDTGLLTFLVRISDICSQTGIQTDLNGLPQGVQRLLALASAVPERKGARKKPQRISFIAGIGEAAIGFVHSTREITDFIGEAFISFARLVLGRARLRRSDLLAIIQECGARALPIVTLISVLVGLILAFVGAIQLKVFGAQIYVADLVGIGMVREMGAIMAGIIMAGRTGAAFAAQLGTMQVNEEIDALKTLGISPVEFLVLPRLIALALMMPLLCVYADLMGIIGGLIVGVGMLDLNIIEYCNHTREAVSLNDFWIGIFMSAVFGVLVALAGCLRGMHCGRSASDVGDAATSAVVTGIVCIIVSTAIITIICDVIGI
ncbi:MAG: ABC transporter permease [Desulfobacterales bacterium]|nr:ABC transporter permease [Desulfobacterales bacterium]MDD4072084.1 ABC transporter permease [Desulfobacterales bacterium]MDD4394088.1 ABC transporter permease [Desulfobacterales bacterium]